jgi:hypothetical protein
VSAVGPVTLSVTVVEALTPAESVTAIVSGKVPVLTGIPLRVPDPERVSPAGKPVTLKLYGGTPPTAPIVCEYAEAMEPLGSDVVAIPSTVSETTRELVTGWESVTCTAKLNAPA